MKNNMQELQIKLPKAAQEYREKRVAQLLKNPMVLAFLEEHGLEDDFIKQHLSQFDRWIRFKEGTTSVEEYRPEGYELELTYRDGHLDFSYVQSLAAAQREQKLAHLKYFRVNHLPAPMRQLSFSTLNSDKENDYYVSAAYQIENIQTSNRGLYLHGSIGSGKTYLMACLCNDVARSKRSVSFVRMSELLSELKALFNDSESTAQIMDGLMTSYLLVIDDIGAENVSAWGRDEILFNVLNYRMENQLKTCFTSNLSIEELKEVYLKQQYGVVDENKVDRLIERVRTLAKPLTLYGNSRRQFLVKD
ncbi:MAG: ATP-binding protein [Erysipelothrix sp.]|nr:ATP-binding protein [Erysipelothrix sp.]